MMDKIVHYLTSEKGVTEVVAKVLARTLTKYPDIESEFVYWIDNRDYNAPRTIEINGYTAGMIHELAPSMDAAGVYSFMVTLRDDPEKARGYIQNGFPRK